MLLFSFLFLTGADTGSNNNAPPMESAGSPYATAGGSTTLASTASPQPHTSSPTNQQAESTTLKDISTATTPHLVNEASPRGPTVNRTHKIIWVTFPNQTLTTGNGKQTRAGKTVHVC